MEVVKKYQFSISRKKYFNMRSKYQTELLFYTLKNFEDLRIYTQSLRSWSSHDENCEGKKESKKHLSQSENLLKPVFLICTEINIP